MAPMKFARTIRPALESDIGYVVDSWLRTMADDLDIPDADERRDPFWRAQNAVIRAIRERARILVACSPKDPSVLLGWACAEPPGILHYVYVRRMNRCDGIAKALVQALELNREAKATHHTEEGYPFVRRLFESLELDPLAGGGA